VSIRSGSGKTSYVSGFWRAESKGEETLREFRHVTSLFKREKTSSSRKEGQKAPEGAINRKGSTGDSQPDVGGGDARRQRVGKYRYDTHENMEMGNPPGMGGASNLVLVCYPNGKERSLITESE